MKLIITYPHQQLYQGIPDVTILPAQEGDISMMNHTISMIGLLRPNSTIYVTNEGTTQTFPVHHGFFKNHNNTCTICLIPTT